MRATEFITEAPLKDYVPIGDFNKPGPFRGYEKKLIPHPVSQLKTAKFFEQTPYDFRLFFSNVSGTGSYKEYGEMDHDTILNSFGKDIAEQLINNSNDAITVMFVGNTGDSKVMMTPWVMAHRLGHAVSASTYRGLRNDKQPKGPWREAETHFFKGINELLRDYYGKSAVNQFGTPMNWNLSKEYSALFNMIGTQKSSRKGLIKRPYEFFYEMFAQYLGTGNITLNRLPSKVDYGRKAWGRSTQQLRLGPDAVKDTEYTTEVLAHDMELMFNNVLSSMVGKIYIM